MILCTVGHIKKQHSVFFFMTELSKRDIEDAIHQGIVFSSKICKKVSLRGCLHIAM